MTVYPTRWNVISNYVGGDDVIYQRWAHRAYILNSAVAAERLVVIEEAGP